MNQFHPSAFFHIVSASVANRALEPPRSVVKAKAGETLRVTLCMKSGVPRESARDKHERERCAAVDVVIE